MKSTHALLLLALALPNVHAEQMSAKDHVLSAFCIAGALGAVAKACYLVYKNSAARAFKKQFSPKLQLLKLRITGHTAWSIAHNGSRADLELFLNNDRGLLNAQNKRGQTLLIDAIETDRESLAHFLLERGTSPNATNKVGRTPLSCAVRKGCEGMVRLLLEHGADSNLPDKSGWNPLAHAIRDNNRDIMRVLFNHGARLDNTSAEPLAWAAKKGHADLVQLLLEHGANPNLEGRNRWKPLSHAIKNAHEEIVQLLLSYGADLHDTSLQWHVLPLTQAASSCGQCQRDALDSAKANIVHILVSRGAEVTTEAVGRCGKVLHDRLYRARDERFFALRHGFDTHAIPQSLSTLMLQLSEQPSSYIDEYNQFCPLAWATSRKDTARVQEILASMPSEKLQSEDGQKALFVAIKNADEEIARILLEAGVGADAQDENGNTPLHLAVAKEGGETLLRLLLENDADTEIENQNGRTPLQKAISDRKGEALDLLLKYGAHFHTDQSHTFFPNELQILANRNNGINYQKLKEFCYKDRLAFIEATNNRLVALKDSLEEWRVPAVLHTVILQLSDRPDFPFERFNHCRLPQAALCGQAEKVSEQLSQGNVDQQSENCRLSLCMAAARGHDAVVHILLDARVKPDVLMSDASPLHWAAYESRETTIRLLLNAGANVDIQNSRKQTPLHNAALTGHEGIVGLLIARGAHINAQDNDHQTPLHKAVSNGHVRATRVLLTSSADTSLADNQGRTALHLAIASDNPHKGNIIAIVQALLEAGCNVNIRNFYGQTALHCAVGDDRSEHIVRLLLRAGADPTISDMNGRTPLALSRSCSMRNLLYAWIDSREPSLLPLPLLLPLG